MPLVRRKTCATRTTWCGGASFFEVLRHRARPGRLGTTRCLGDLPYFGGREAFGIRAWRTTLRASLREAFRKGLSCPPDERLPTDALRPYELNLSDLSTRPGENYEKSRVGPHRFAVTLRIAMQWRTALGATLVSAIGLMFMSALYLMALRNCARHLHKDEYEWLALVTKDIVGEAGFPIKAPPDIPSVVHEARLCGACHAGLLHASNLLWHCVQVSRVLHRASSFHKR